MKKTTMVASALALAIAFSSGSQAASLIGPDSKVQTESLTQQVKAKKGMHKKHRMRRHAAAGKGPGRCGENMYWSGKHGHCRDARDKA